MATASRHIMLEALFGIAITVSCLESCCMHCVSALQSTRARIANKMNCKDACIVFQVIISAHQRAHCHSLAFYCSIYTYS
jgi:hypothetical protein